MDDTRGTGMAYLLLAMSVFGVAGLHRFYLGRPLTGLLWLLTFGLFGIGTLVDLFYVPLMVDAENRRLGFYEGGRSLDPGAPGPRLGPGPEFPALAPPPPVRAIAPRLPPMTTEQSILQIAKDNDGRVTVAMVALGAGLSLRKAQRELDRLCKNGHAERDVSTEGAFLYVFRGLRSTDIFDIDAV